MIDTIRRRIYSDFGPSKFLPAPCLQLYLSSIRDTKREKNRSSSPKQKNVKKNALSGAQTGDKCNQPDPTQPINLEPHLHHPKLKRRSRNRNGWSRWRHRLISRTKNQESLIPTQDDYLVPQIGTVIQRNGTFIFHPRTFPRFSRIALLEWGHLGVEIWWIRISDFICMKSHSITCRVKSSTGAR